MAISEQSMIDGLGNPKAILKILLTDIAS